MLYACRHALIHLHTNIGIFLSILSKPFVLKCAAKNLKSIDNKICMCKNTLKYGYFVWATGNKGKSLFSRKNTLV